MNITSAPELQVSQWFNTDSPISIESLRGRVVVIEAFQMLCPGCVLHGIPQAKEISKSFSCEEVVVLGLHTVFEHHDAMRPVSLEAFIHEYGITFPVGVDEESGEANNPLPKTMQSYRLRGTPSLLVIDQSGQIRFQHFGQVSDMQIACEISGLVYQNRAP